MSQKSDGARNESEVIDVTQEPSHPHYTTNAKTKQLEKAVLLSLFGGKVKTRQHENNHYVELQEQQDE